MDPVHISPELADEDPILWENVRNNGRRIDDDFDYNEDEHEAA